MKKSLFVLAFFPLLLPVLAGNNDGVVIENYTRVEASGGNAKTESSVSTTVNGENVTVKTNQPGSVEVKNINGKVEVKTSKGITPTIIITGVPTQNIEFKEKDQKEGLASLSKIINNRTSSIYSFLKGLFRGVFGLFLKKT